jgi:hypothetical protein
MIRGLEDQRIRGSEDQRIRGSEDQRIRGSEDYNIKTDAVPENPNMAQYLCTFALEKMVWLRIVLIKLDLDFPVQII